MRIIAPSLSNEGGVHSPLASVQLAYRFLQILKLLLQLRLPPLFLAQHLELVRTLPFVPHKRFFRFDAVDGFEEGL